MHFDHAKRSYYRFPSKNSVMDTDLLFPYYFPEKDSHASEVYDSFINSNYNSYDHVHDNLHSKGDIL